MSSARTPFFHADFRSAIEYVRSFDDPALWFVISANDFEHRAAREPLFPSIRIENRTGYRNPFPQDVRAAAVRLLMSRLADRPHDSMLRALVLAAFASSYDAIRRLYEIMGADTICCPLPENGLAVGLPALVTGLKAYGRLEAVADRIHELRGRLAGGGLPKGVPGRAAVSPSAAFQYVFRAITKIPNVREIAEREAAAVLAERGWVLRRDRQEASRLVHDRMWDVIQQLLSVLRAVKAGHALPEGQPEAAVRDAVRLLADLVDAGVAVSGSIIGDSFPRNCPNLAHLLYAALPPNARGASYRKFAQVLPHDVLVRYRTGVGTAEEALIRAEKGAVDWQQAVTEGIFPVFRDFNLCIVLDVSGSMKPAVETLNGMMDYLSMVTGTFERPVHLVMVGDGVRHRILWQPERISVACNGDTPLFQGIRLGLRTGADILLILTDWGHNVGQPVTPRFLDRQIQLNEEPLDYRPLTLEEIGGTAIFAINFSGMEPPKTIRERVISISGANDRIRQSLLELSTALTEMHLRRMQVDITENNGFIEIKMEVLRRGF